MVSTKSLVLALASTLAVSATQIDTRLQKRASDSSTQRLDIPLTFDSRGRRVTTVIMSPGRGQQQFNFTMTTSSGLTYVAGVACSTCSGATLYNQTESSTAQTFSSADDVPLFGELTGASVIKESCQLKQDNGSVWPYPNQTIIVLDQQLDPQLEQDSNADIGSGLSGLIGIGTNRGSPSNASGFSANFEDSIMGQFFLRNSAVANFTFGMMLNSPLNTPRGSNASSAPVDGAGTSAGVLHWLQPDPSAYDTSKVSWLNATNDAAGGVPTVDTNTTGSGDWFVSLDGWVMNAGNNHVSNTQSVVATVDPMYTEMYLPADQARLIHDAIPNSTLRTDLSSLGPLSEAWSIPCDSSFSFGLIADSQTFTMDQNTLIIPLSDGTHRAHTHRVTAAQYDHPQEIEKPEEGGVQPYTLVSPTNVQLTSGPESSAGSSGFSPVGSGFSPTGTSTTAGTRGPLIALGDDDHAVDIAPPSYEEASEGSPGASPNRPEFVSEKARYRRS
ncbi:hypothetical protein NM688_g3373 [Phlebia brevispora]|uniref:Uncharacterized protein n=1 Tax=Phlebia brevispora TaxID=194682 RepID=A0ACC1T641_9APHY|nr:hypothetical protein NM688_g3373 [Phlebia brevispora]